MCMLILRELFSLGERDIIGVYLLVSLGLSNALYHTFGTNHTYQLIPPFHDRGALQPFQQWDLRRICGQILHAILERVRFKVRAIRFN
ncbi:hypothetical protein VTK73DRAFT_7635 [Phialemonium thermophilum]|uniref:Uncharacterized protein n=1 Tax=Phialemonium thermophilum TaxID=223376 RepID=A0ABR3Y6C8_9PEZI